MIGKAAGIAGGVAHEVTGDFEAATAETTETQMPAATTVLAPVATASVAPSTVTVAQAPASKTEPLNVTVAPSRSTRAVHLVEDLTSRHATHTIKNTAYPGTHSATNKEVIHSNGTSANAKPDSEEPESAAKHKSQVNKSRKPHGHGVSFLQPRMTPPTMLALNSAISLVAQQSYLLPVNATYLPAVTASAVETLSSDFPEKRWDDPESVAETTASTTVDNAVDAMAAPVTYTTCVPEQACYGIDGTLTTPASVPSQV